MLATGLTMGLAEWIIDDTCLVKDFFSPFPFIVNYTLIKNFQNNVIGDSKAPTIDHSLILADAIKIWKGLKWENGGPKNKLSDQRLRYGNFLLSLLGAWSYKNCKWLWKVTEGLIIIREP